MINLMCAMNLSVITSTIQRFLSAGCGLFSNAFCVSITGARVAAHISRGGIFWLSQVHLSHICLLVDRRSLHSLYDSLSSRWDLNRFFEVRCILTNTMLSQYSLELLFESMPAASAKHRLLSLLLSHLRHIVEIYTITLLMKLVLSVLLEVTWKKKNFRTSAVDVRVCCACVSTRIIY